MKIKILGSGGFKTNPQPSCLCEVCVSARTDCKLSRTGPGIYLPDLDLLIDTPLESKYQLDRLGHLPTKIIYSHWHPDHTEGYRVFESYKSAPNVYIQPESKILEKVPGLEFLEKIKKIKLVVWQKSESVKNGPNEITWLTLNEEIPVYTFLLSNGEKQALICPDHCKFLLDLPIEANIDILVMNMGDMADSSGKITTFDDNLNIIKKLKPKRTILTHVEEHFCITEEKKKQIESRYKEYGLEISSDDQVIDF